MFFIKYLVKESEFLEHVIFQFCPWFIDFDYPCTGYVVDGNEWPKINEPRKPRQENVNAS